MALKPLTPKGGFSDSQKQIISNLAPFRAGGNTPKGELLCQILL
jgi:hypothetical protein